MAKENTTPSSKDMIVRTFNNNIKAVLYKEAIYFLLNLPVVSQRWTGAKTMPKQGHMGEIPNSTAEVQPRHNHTDKAGPHG